MDRRADRAIAVSAIAAVAIVPTVLLVAMNGSAASPKDARDLPPAAAAAQNGPDRPEGAPAPSASASPGRPAAAGLPKAGPGGTLPKAGPPVKPVKINSYSRVTDARLTRMPIGDRQRVREATGMVLSPKFSQRTRGVHERTFLGITTETRVGTTIQGRTITTYEGIRKTTTSLSAKQVAQLKAVSDPRLYTFAVYMLPGSVKKGPDAQGRMHYSGRTKVGNVIGFLPQSLVGDVLKLIPPDTPVYLNVWADKVARPSLFTVSATARTGALASRTTFGDYK